MNKFVSGFLIGPVLISLLLIGLGLSGSRALAQSASGSDEYSFYLGEDLPTAIDGVTEILPVFGGRYGLQTARVGTVEFGFFNTHAKGVDFTTVEASLRGSSPISPGIDGVFYGGLDFNYYRPTTDEDRTTAYGVHVGAGVVMSVTDTVSLRGDLKFMGGPGSNLYLLFGVVFK
jgi:hypothetical protein